jgi:F-type H+-transporting ATPase subunit b
LVWKPTKDALEKQRLYIQNEIQQAEKARKEAFEKLAEAEKAILEAHTHAKTIVGNATNQAYLNKEKIEGEGKINAKRIVDDAQLEAAKLETAIKANNEKEIIDIAFTAAEALIKKNITDADSKKQVAELIKKMSAKKDKA